jgi:hypothetical protein
LLKISEHALQQKVQFTSQECIKHDEDELHLFVSIGQNKPLLRFGLPGTQHDDDSKRGYWIEAAGLLEVEPSAAHKTVCYHTYSASKGLHAWHARNAAVHAVGGKQQKQN